MHTLQKATYLGSFFYDIHPFIQNKKARQKNNCSIFRDVAG